jgi:hypothetical protein
MYNTACYSPVVDVFVIRTPLHLPRRLCEHISEHAVGLLVNEALEVDGKGFIADWVVDERLNVWVVSGG